MSTALLEYLPAELPPMFLDASRSEATVEDEWIWIAVAAALVLFGGVAAACRAVCWGTPKKCKTTWYGSIDVECR